jgi:uncharacterized protein YcbX
MTSPLVDLLKSIKFEQNEKMEHQVSQLYVYPIKSLKGIAVNSAILSSRGIKYDRRWMLVDQYNQFITQREIPALVLFDVQFGPDGLTIQHPAKSEACLIPFRSKFTDIVTTKVWNDECIGGIATEPINSYFSSALNQQVKLIFHPETGKRNVANHGSSRIGFSDSNQYMILGENSLALLNSKLSESLPMNRFRPNIVFSGGEPHDEDQWKKIQIGTSRFEVVKPCARCQVTTINQESGAIGVEPLRTFASYRRFDRKILFGQHLKLVSDLPATIHIGDSVVGK